MGSGSRGLLLCKSSSSLVFLIPSFTCNNLRFNKTIASSRAHRMATEASSSSSSVTGGDSINPLASSSVNGAAFSSSSSCIKMAIVHDIAEAIVGDITPSDGIPKEEKSQREREAITYMCKLLGEGARAKEIDELWMEYEENSTAEAKIVKDFDKAEMILQAVEYENEQGKDLEEFFQSTAGKFQTELGKAWAAEIVSRRKK
ncbi:5'-deoxynucleotidase [Citrus sinensis]|nr:5'-deoxynucleotidase [Citrus sinensis]